jgi:hypothetical protein
MNMNKTLLKTLRNNKIIPVCVQAVNNYSYYELCVIPAESVRHIPLRGTVKTATPKFKTAVQKRNNARSVK